MNDSKKELLAGGVAASLAMAGMVAGTARSMGVTVEE